MVATILIAAIGWLNWEIEYFLDEGRGEIWRKGIKKIAAELLIIDMNKVRELNQI